MMVFTKKNPASIEATNTPTFGWRDTEETTAGPGQKPPSPQPRPKSSAPMMSLGVMFWVLGVENSVPNSGVERFLVKKYTLPCTVMAPIMTNAREGSQSLVSARNPMTLLGSVMPEIPNPMANMNPHNKERSAFILYSQPRVWR